ncbi:MAG: hypothetical protein F4Z31_16900 [Gemmatimonadetes bacterium]|nr:hypothetical protein [Gemmatimonadota bacterium]MYA43410.1 hypothetical protein [Gemmatimonadota bacterium]MYE94931.1 hypothetical protein [Gemmatimonadota bacterium]MYJ11448.1 hypothetical protein [Gemmatimonadota bacterium]
MLAEAARNAEFRAMREHRPDAAASGLATLRNRAVRDKRDRLLEALEDKPGRSFFSLLFGNSPYLTRMLLRDTQFAEALASQSSQALADRVLEELSAADPTMNRDRLMRLLRRQRSRVAILVAACDCYGVWDVMQCAATLSETADRTVHLATEHLLLDRVRRGELAHPGENPAGPRWGYFLLAAGRHGARELGYTGDLSLIALYDPDVVEYTGTRSPEDCFARVTRDMARILQARTRHGYVFRTDLRLRPDAPATPLAITRHFALEYYRRSGRTWERATLINARPVAGDVTAGSGFLSELRPFIWEEGLDFDSVEDIHSISRQIHRFRRRGAPRARGLDLALSPGGIREIEFFVLMHQLAYGGRSRHLRGSGVLPMLDTIEREHFVLPREAADLRDAYLTLRRVEHRVQMVNDQPTRALPASRSGLDNVACLAGLESGDELTVVAQRAMERVHQLFQTRFTAPEKKPDLTELILDGPAGGPEPQPVLREEGFRKPQDAVEIFRGWAEGGHASTSSARARAAVRAVLPELIAALGRTPDPDRALTRIDHFFDALPADVSFFPMVKANTWLLNLVAVVMGSAPGLAESLRLNPRILEAVLDPAFFLPLPDREALASALSERLDGVDDFRERVATLEVWTREHRFQIGIQTLQNLVTSEDALRCRSDLADIAAATVLQMAIAETGERFGAVAGSRCAVLALGDLGARELAHDSTLDLVLVADYPSAGDATNPGDHVDEARFYDRIASRLFSTLEHHTEHGSLYRVREQGAPDVADPSPTITLHQLLTRLSGAMSTRDLMALVRSRVICGDEQVRQAVERGIRDALSHRVDPGQLAEDVAAMRRLRHTDPPDDPFGLSHGPGGLLDLRLLAQYLVVRYAHAFPQTISGETLDCFETLAAAEAISAEELQTLADATRMQRAIRDMLGLASEGGITIHEAPGVLREKLAVALQYDSPEALEEGYGSARDRVFGIFQNRVELKSG